MSELNEVVEPLELERTTLEEVKGFFPDELSEPLEEFVGQLEDLGLEIEPHLDAAVEFGEAVLEEGLDIAREYLDEIGTLIDESGMLEKFGEFAPVLQEALEAAGRAVMGGLENVEAADVARLLGIGMLAYLKPRLLVHEADGYLNEVEEMADRVLQGASQGAGSAL